MYSFSFKTFRNPPTILVHIPMRMETTETAHPIADNAILK